MTVVLSRLFVLALLLSAPSLQLLAQSPTFSNVVESTNEGNKVFLQVNLPNLQQSVDTLFARIDAVSASVLSQSWGDVLNNGSNPGMDIDFSGYDINGLGGLTSTGTLTADSLSLNKDADITGRLSVSNVASFGDSLTVTGYVAFSDSLEVVKAVTIGQTLYVTGVTSLGDSLHVSGNVDFNALFHADGAATFGSTLEVAGITTLNDSLVVNSGARIAHSLTADSLSVTDVINGQIGDLSNHDTGNLTEGSNLYFTAARAIAALSDTLAHLIGRIEALESQSQVAETFTCGTSTVTYDGHDYATVEIGSQCWFAENLRSTKYNDDAVIPSELDATWSTTTDGAVTIYDEGEANEETNLATYGRLYNWYAVNTGKLCPSGWHVPTDEEWTALTTQLGGEYVAGAEMKSSASDTPAWDGSNSSGFSGLPGGDRSTDGNFNNVGSFGSWWSSSPHNSNAWNRRLFSGSGYVSRGSYGLRNGFSVRCVRD